MSAEVVIAEEKGIKLHAFKSLRKGLQLFSFNKLCCICDVFIMLYLIVLIINKRRMGCDILRKLKPNEAEILKEPRPSQLTRSG